MMKKILIANRGEIACRVIRACRELDIGTVAVYSEVDRKSLHVQMADEAILIGPPPPLESYLNIDALLAAAKQSKTDAIHPGYGFLAENPEFARRCEEEGITFIGPSSKTLSLVGDKIKARETMEKAGVPIIPGSKFDIRNSLAEGRAGKTGLAKFGVNLESEGEKIGYPLIIKAALGGGGKGMRIVRSEKEMEKAVEAGRREAKSAFGDETIYLEKYLSSPRHIEFQILADGKGNVVHLFERECSIQRRHQKIVEETPSTALSPELRSRMGEVALEVAKASHYTNAGTVEFLLDPNGNFYFLEVNARIQVEHPITELTTGVDLVKEQIRIARGESLSKRQEDLHQRGHAIECRIYAEDPKQGFLPSPGQILFLKEPSGPGIRHDSGIFSGWEVTPDYDPILSKLITWGETREVARKRMIAALNDLTILGIETTVDFLKGVMNHPEFIQGRTTTDFIDRHMKDWNGEESDSDLQQALIAGAIFSYMKSGKGKLRIPHSALRTPHLSPWLTVGKWELGSRSS
ncbi:acetyl-CoA carboxylase biotin carboxylase subunit [candidate division TA06 bacterium]|nr:acetyl-CoA carboxylase biotin carboxylase subunit [candidate division TA06 bacterium]